VPISEMSKTPELTPQILEEANQKLFARLASIQQHEENVVVPFQDADNPTSDLELAVLLYHSEQAEMDGDIQKAGLLQSIFLAVVPKNNKNHINTLKEAICDIISGKPSFHRNNNTRIGINVYSIHKSGTMFLHKLFKDICQNTSFNYFSENNHPPNHTHLHKDIAQSFCQCPIRDYDILALPDSMEDALQGLQKFKNIDQIICIFHVRDPRDLLVSKYFSQGWIHVGFDTGPSAEYRKWVQSVSIDQFVLADNITYTVKTRYDNIVKMHSMKLPGAVYVRYRDMVLNFREWLSQVISPLNFENEELIADYYYRKYCDEFEPKAETFSHKRKVIPGDHKVKLKPATIEKLNAIYSDVIRIFNFL